MIQKLLKISRADSKLYAAAKGFTLIELMVAVIIIGILVGISVPRYVRIVEKGRVSEAKHTLGLIRSAEAVYFVDHDSYTTDLASLELELPTACTPNYYYTYYVTGGGSSFTAWATRCTSGGKSPNYASAAYQVNLAHDGALGGDQGYI